MVKNFGLDGISGNVQFGKNNGRIRFDGTNGFQVRDSADAAFATLTVADPTASAHAATKAYVDSVAQGLTVKASVRAATTANITLSGEQTIDGVSVVSGNRVLVKNQGTQTQNGIYIASSGAWTRSDDASTGSELVSAFVFVEEGTANADTGWVQTTNSPITLGSSNIVFAQFSGAGTYTAGNGLDLTGSTFSVNTGNGIQITADAVAVRLNSNAGLVSNIGAGTNELAINLASTSGLQVSTNALSIDLVTNSGLALGTDGLGVDLDTDPGLVLGAGGIKVLLDTDSGLNLGTGGLSIGAGDGLIASGGDIDVNVGNGITISSDAVTILRDGTDSGLALGTAGVRVAFNGTASGLQRTSSGIGLLLDTNSGLQTAATGVSIDLDTNPGLVIGAGGVKVQLDGTTSGLQLTSSGVSVDLKNSDPGLTIGTDGIAVLLQTSNSGLALNGGLHVVVGQGIEVDGTNGIEAKVFNAGGLAKNFGAGNDEIGIILDGTANSSGLNLGTSGIRIDLRDTTPGLELVSTGLGILLGTSNSGLTLTGGLSVVVGQGIEVDGTNGIEARLSSTGGLTKALGAGTNELGVVLNGTDSGLSVGASGIRIEFNGTASGLQRTGTGVGILLNGTASGLVLTSGGIALGINTLGTAGGVSGTDEIALYNGTTHVRATVADVVGAASAQSSGRRAAIGNGADSVNIGAVLPTLGTNNTYITRVFLHVTTAFSGGSVNQARIVAGTDVIMTFDENDILSTGTYVVDLPGVFDSNGEQCVIEFFESDGTTPATPTGGAAIATVEFTIA